MIIPDLSCINFKREHSVLFFIIALSAILNITAHAQISFKQQIFYDVGTSPEAVCIGDVNNDGLNDVVVGNDFYFDPTTDYKIFVFIQDSRGNLMTPRIYSYPKVYPGLTCLLIKDLNNDNLNDVAIAYGDSIGIFYQNITGNLDPVESFYSGDKNTVDGLSAGDLNSDGLTDIAISHWGGNVISVFYQNSIGGFAVQNYLAPNTGRDQIEVADLNNDQRNDVVLMSGGSYNSGVHVFTQNSSGTLNSYISYFPPNLSYNLDGITVGDINNDQITDIVEIAYEQLVLRPQNQNTHTFDSLMLIDAYSSPNCVRIADLNCDGINEIIIAHGGSYAATIYEHAVNGNYHDYISFKIFTNTNMNHHGLSVGDINNDGRKDILTVCDFYGLAVLINQSVNNEFVEKPQTPAGESQICFNGERTSYITHSAFYDSIQWILYPPEAGEIISSNQDSCQILWNDSWQGTGGLYVIARNNCGSRTSDTLFISSDRLQLINLGNDTTICENSTILLNVGKDFTGLLWQDNSTNSVFTVKKAGIYYVRASNICGSSYDTILITQVPLPEIEIKDTTICENNYLQLNISKPGFSRYLWQDGSITPVYTISSSGIYTVEITDSNNCRNIQSISVRELTIPTLQWPSDTTICSSSVLTLSAESPDSRYLWQDGSNQPQYHVSESGNYSVSVWNHCGATQASMNVKVAECMSYLEVPSAFSPNGDGLNDVIYPEGYNVEDVHFLIFNRWGQKVFESTSLTVGWDGTYMGKILDQGVFVYLITGVSTNDRKQIEKKGNISLIR